MKFEIKISWANTIHKKQQSTICICYAYS